MENILVLGASGQIGSELVMALRRSYGSENIIASDIKLPSKEVMESGPFEKIDLMDKNRIEEVYKKYKFTQIYHLAAILSAICEQKPLFAWNLNMTTLMNILEFGREKKIKKIFWPSSIGTFGPTTPKQNVQQTTIMEPNTVYGISKSAGERWVEYYFNKYGLDTRGLRFPGLISYKTEPGGGTTDYAVEIYFEAIRKKHYTSFLKADTKLPMMFMNDAIRGIMELMEAPAEKISVRSNYNFAAINNLDAKSIAEEIKKHIPEFEIEYKPDFRQKIADSWPASIDDNVARKDWGWKPEFDLTKMTKVMLKKIKENSKN